jgi:hypothetical protein
MLMAWGGIEEKMRFSIGRVAIWAFVLLLMSSYASAAPPQIPLVIGAGASGAEKFAAEELATHLQHLYPDQQFSVTTSEPSGASHILLGTVQSLPQLAQYVPASSLAKPESFVVSTAREGNAEIGVVAGADPRGALYAVYGLLEKLGYGFYLSYNTEPAPRAGPFQFEGWKLSDAPLFPDRAVLPWHNFLSGSSAWDLPDWQHWMTQIGRMRYNTVMVHCYGNSPIFTFNFRGRTKPVGYFTSTTKGNEWGTQHANDVRRLFGGESFTGPVFGSSIAMVPDDKRSEAAIGLMQQVFGLAHRRGFHISFVLDVETLESNPQELIRELPASARLGSSDFQLANPDTPDGYEYYRAEVSSLFALYPQIDRLVLFFRLEDTPWRDIKSENFPEPWKAQFAAALARNPQLRDDGTSVPMFILSRMIVAYNRVLGELGRTDVKLAGSAFLYHYIPAADYFFPPETGLVVMDQAETIEADGVRELLERIGAHRQVYPVFWANHDGRGYLIRPYTPYANLTTFLRTGNCTGLSIIHWDTRPIDLYFKSLGAQLWEQTADQPLAVTAREMAAHTFGESTRETGGEYLLKWVTDAPRFGRETTDRFITSILKDPAGVVAKCQERLNLLAKIGQGRLVARGRQWVEYYSGLERFVAAFFNSETAYEEAQSLREEGHLDEARQALARSKPEAVIGQFAQLSSLGGITKGEQGLIVSMNLRWLPYITSERQAEGLEPIRLRFEPTFHDPLAMDGGVNTFYFDHARHIWKGLGEKETHLPVFTETSEAPTDDVCSAALRIEGGISFRLGPIMGDNLVPGTYTVHLIFAPQPVIADINLRGSATLLPATDKLIIHHGGTQPVEITRTLEVTQGALQVRISPTFGTAYVCGATLEPQARTVTPK